MTLADITAEVNRLAVGRPIGRLQDLRKEHLGLARKASTELFPPPPDPEWTLHRGGRTELQFNLGLECDRKDFRYGVAFSFETSPTLPSIDRLIPKVARFNQYVRENSEELAGLSMWHFKKGREGQTRSVNHDPMPVAEALVRPGVFVFLGGLGRSDAPDYVHVLDVLDRLLPLYLFVEGHHNEPVATRVSGPFEFNKQVRCE